MIVIAIIVWAVLCLIVLGSIALSKNMEEKRDN